MQVMNGLIPIWLPLSASLEEEAIFSFCLGEEAEWRERERRRQSSRGERRKKFVLNGAVQKFRLEKKVFPDAT
jgi:hypothetical protein